MKIYKNHALPCDFFGTETFRRIPPDMFLLFLLPLPHAGAAKTESCRNLWKSIDLSALQSISTQPEARRPVGSAAGRKSRKKSPQIQEAVKEEANKAGSIRQVLDMVVITGQQDWENGPPRHFPLHRFIYYSRAQGYAELAVLPLTCKFYSVLGRCQELVKKFSSLEECRWGVQGLCKLSGK